MTPALRMLAHTLAVCSALATSAVWAQSAPQAVEISALRPKESAPLPRVIEAVFQFDDGRRAVVSAQGETVLLRYGRRRELSLLHDGHGRYVSANAEIAARFDLDTAGEPARIHLSAPANWF